MRLLHASQLKEFVGFDPGGVTESTFAGVDGLGTRSLHTRQVNEEVRGAETGTGTVRGGGFTGTGGLGVRIVQTVQPLLKVVVGTGAGRGGWTGIGCRNETGAGRGGGMGGVRGIGTGALRGGGTGDGRGSGTGAGRGGLTTDVVGPGARTVQPLLGPFGPGLNSRHPQVLAM